MLTCLNIKLISVFITPPQQTHKSQVINKPALPFRVSCSVSDNAIVEDAQTLWLPFLPNQPPNPAKVFFLLPSPPLLWPPCLPAFLPFMPFPVPAVQMQWEMSELLRSSHSIPDCKFRAFSDWNWYGLSHPSCHCSPHHLHSITFTDSFIPLLGSGSIWTMRKIP